MAAFDCKRYGCRSSSELRSGRSSPRATSSGTAKEHLEGTDDECQLDAMDTKSDR